MAPLQDNRAEVSEAHDDTHGDGRAQVVPIQTQVPGATVTEVCKSVGHDIDQKLRVGTLVWGPETRLLVRLLR